MSRLDDLRELLGEIDGHAAVSEELLAAAQTLVTEDIPRIGRNTTTSVAAAGLIENYYTALETVLFRVSQNFGNNLDGERWHSDLLRRMTIAVPDVRPAVVSTETHEMLDELMRFRHFRRYYFHLRYDWHRLDYLLGLVDRVEPRVRAELSAFRCFLVELISEIEVPLRESWLGENGDALKSVRQGLRDSAEGDVHDLGSFASPDGDDE